MLFERYCALEITRFLSFSRHSAETLVGFTVKHFVRHPDGILCFVAAIASRDSAVPSCPVPIAHNWIIQDRSEVEKSVPGAAPEAIRAVVALLGRLFCLPYAL